MTTLKQIGDQIRKDLATATASGYLPGRAGDGYGQTRYDVRVSNAKTGPKVNITINGYEWLILTYAQHWGALAAKGASSDIPQALSDVADDVYSQWRDTEGKALIAKVDEVAARQRWIAPDGTGLVGDTKFGVCIVAVTPTRLSREGTGYDDRHYDPRLYCAGCRVEILRGEFKAQAVGRTPGQIDTLCEPCNKTFLDTGK